MPLTPTWKVRVVRRVPFPAHCGKVFEDVLLPLSLDGATNPKTLALTPNTPLAALTGTRGGALVVRWTGQTETMYGDRVALQLALDGLDRPGVYNGPVVLVPAGSPPSGAENRKVDLTVDVTDWIVLPAATLLLGVLAATWLADVVLPWLWVRMRTKALSNTYREKRRQFLLDTRGKPYATDDIHTALVAELGEINALVSWRSLTPLNETNPSFKAATERLKQAQDLVQSWGTFGKELTVLDGGLATINKTTPQPPAGPGRNLSEPLFATNAASLLTGNPMLPLDRYKKMREEVKAATTVAKGWNTLSDRVKEDRTWIKQLRSLACPETQGQQAGGRKEGDNCVKLVEAEKTILSVWWDLWHATDASRLDVKLAADTL